MNELSLMNRQVKGAFGRETIYILSGYPPKEVYVEKMESSRLDSRSPDSRGLGP